ncbi:MULTISPECIES: SpoIIE family protein phosphatase [Streptomyces]|uniref:SpoIIE family protein phosphatase n=1 Tax=Streptomyces TaxID=1883 RepID=UPI001D1336A9|nr:MULTISPECIES: SpoIIE family protein phosphatase [Streptomyces]MCC3654981.1 SpoIIE family protein phosphatase [Streptomyces sp. S07_1.15]WSQ70675.1 SpoIIE family protein phosphatase [Streptomyces xinghaiensis]
MTSAVRDTDAYGAALYLPLPGEHALRLDTLIGVQLDFIAPWARVPLSAPTPGGDAVRERRFVWVSGTGELSRRYPQSALILPYDFRLAAAPLLSAGVCHGTILLFWPASHDEHLPGEERERIEELAAEMAGVLHRAAGAGEPLRPLSATRVLPGPGGAPTPGGRSAPLAVAGFLERLPEGCCALGLDARITYISRRAAELLDRGVEELMGALPWEVLPWLDDPVYEDRYRAAVISRQATSFTALRPPDQWLTFQLYPDATGISVLISPAHVEEHPEQPGKPGSRPGEPTRVGSIYQLMHLAGALTKATGARQVMELAADHLMPAFGASGFALLIAEGGRMHQAGHRGFPDSTLNLFDGIPVSGHAPVARALAQGTPVFLASPEERVRLFPESPPPDQVMHAWAFLPLIASGRPVGTCVLGYEDPHPFPPEEKAALSSVSGLLAQALDRAQLYEAKHRLAQSLQRSLLPQSLPPMAGRLDIAARYASATRGMDIGGDFYDLIRLDPVTAGAFIGDVQGHNVTAAALMGQVRTAVHAHASVGAPPDEVLTRANRLVTDLDPGLFTSCLYAHLDLSRHRALLASAGHPPPLLHIPGHGTRVLQVPPGLLLGIDSGARYEVAEVGIPAGSLLVLYTDGLVERPGEDIGLSVSALADRVSALADLERLDDIADALVQPAEAGAQRADDVALLLLRPC